VAIITQVGIRIRVRVRAFFFKAFLDYRICKTTLYLYLSLSLSNPNLTENPNPNPMIIGRGGVIEGGVIDTTAESSSSAADSEKVLVFLATALDVLFFLAETMVSLGREREIDSIILTPPLTLILILKVSLTLNLALILPILTPI
jgi:hypothetical protein